MDNRLMVSGTWTVPILQWYPSSEKGIGQRTESGTYLRCIWAGAWVALGHRSITCCWKACCPFPLAFANPRWPHIHSFLELASRAMPVARSLGQKLLGMDGASGFLGAGCGFLAG